MAAAKNVRAFVCLCLRLHDDVFCLSAPFFLQRCAPSSVHECFVSLVFSALIFEFIPVIFSCIFLCFFFSVKLFHCLSTARLSAHQDFFTV
jgi:hypothetical protein